MNYNETFEKVKQLLLNQLPVDENKIKPESRLIQDLGADSANIMILVCDVESEFGIEVDNGALMQMSTVDDVVRYLTK